MKYFLISLCLLSSFVSCNKKKTQEEKIISLLKDSLLIDSNYDKIYILQSSGCYNCNIKFGEYLAQKKMSTKDLVIVSTYNVDGFIKGTQLENLKNVVLDRKSLFFRSAVLNHSAVIFFENKKIDTIVNLSDARVFHSNMNYIQNR